MCPCRCAELLVNQARVCKQWKWQKPNREDELWVDEKITLLTRAERVLGRWSHVAINNLVEGRELFRLQHSQGQWADFNISPHQQTCPCWTSIIPKAARGSGFVFPCPSLTVKYVLKIHQGPITPNMLHICPADCSLTLQHLFYKPSHILTGLSHIRSFLPIRRFGIPTLGMCTPHLAAICFSPHLVFN